MIENKNLLCMFSLINFTNFRSNAQNAGHFHIFCGGYLMSRFRVFWVDARLNKRLIQITIITPELCIGPNLLLNLVYLSLRHYNSPTGTSLRMDEDIKYG